LRDTEIHESPGRFRMASDCESPAAAIGAASSDLIFQFFSVQPLSPPCLCGGKIQAKTHHRDTENTEVAQRISNEVPAGLCLSFLLVLAEDVIVVAKQKYRLTPVLEVRGKAKQTAARLVATRREQLAAAEAELLRRQQALAGCRQLQTLAEKRMLAECEQSFEAQTLVTHRTHLADLRRSEEELLSHVREQQRSVALAEMNVEKALIALVEAAKEVQVIEKHRENWREQSRREEQLKEQKTGDEIGAVTYRRSRSQ
jgi:flagellar export protein FliJ